jgi:hypothetical protein
VTRRTGRVTPRPDRKYHAPPAEILPALADPDGVAEEIEAHDPHRLGIESPEVDIKNLLAQKNTTARSTSMRYRKLGVARLPDSPERIGGLATPIIVKAGKSAIDHLLLVISTKH